MPPSREQGKCAYYNVPAQAGFSPRNELVNWIRVCPMARGLRSAPGPLVGTLSPRHKNSGASFGRGAATGSTDITRRLCAEE